MIEPRNTHALKEDRHNRQQPKSPHLTQEAKDARLERHPCDGHSIKAGPKKGGSGGSGSAHWGKLGEEVGGLDSIHNEEDLDAEEAALSAEGGTHDQEVRYPRQGLTIADFVIPPKAAIAAN